MNHLLSLQLVVPEHSIPNGPYHSFTFRNLFKETLSMSGLHLFVILICLVGYEEGQ